MSLFSLELASFQNDACVLIHNNMSECFFFFYFCKLVLSARVFDILGFKKLKEKPSLDIRI